MNFIDDNELFNLKRDYDGFKMLGNSVLKAAYMAASGRGFTEIIKSKDAALLLRRPADDLHVCLFLVTPKPPEIKQPEQIALFNREIDLV